MAASAFRLVFCKHHCALWGPTAGPVGGDGIGRRHAVVILHRAAQAVGVERLSDGGVKGGVWHEEQRNPWNNDKMVSAQP